MKSLLHPTYFPSIAQFSVIVKSDAIVFEKFDNFQKQTYRNRMYVYGANGKQMLSIPIKHTGKDGRQLYKDVKVENDFPWQKQHWKSLQTAYRTSPFFEFYEDEIAPLFEKKQEYLLDFNISTFETISDCLQLETDYSFTNSYATEITDNDDLTDFRKLVNAKKINTPSFDTYTQVFDSKEGFLNNLSILDLLFNEGPNSLTYLEDQFLKIHL
ncbi:WbqC-like protein family protein [Pustulibacterium marinum]|uniref:WbqC-like protein family protein n=1 Tax=Pustulibacterium marinum TaxID=1224947 RepID=A0A1I7H5T9_9FLAO|nr:WbqC family protein [Pustulibacterium marinum]SFU56058.1 WbqC-like protein family protein [Pustulibacterium marinum]